MKHTRLFLVYGVVLLSLLCHYYVRASDTAVQQFTTQQAIGTIATFDAYQAGFRITSSPAKCRSVFPVSSGSSTVDFLSNTLILQQDLIFDDVTTIYQLGTIWGANYAVSLPQSVKLFPVNPLSTVRTFSQLAIMLNGDIAWQEQNVHFNGNASLINGQGNTMTLASNSQITIDSKSSLLLQDITIKNLDNTKIVCTDSTSTVSLKNVTLVLDGNYTFAQGKLAVLQNTRIAGYGQTFIYTSNQPCAVSSGATLMLDVGLTFSYGSAASTNLTFADSTAQLFMNSATLHAGNALQISNGTILVDGLSYLNDPANKGITFNPSASVIFLPAATVQQRTGTVKEYGS